MWSLFVTEDTTGTEGSVRVTAVSLLKGRDCVNWHLWNQLIQRCSYCRGRDSLEPIELSLIQRCPYYRGFRRERFYQSQRDRPKIQLSAVQRCLHYRGQYCKKFGGGEGRGGTVNRSARERCPYYRGAYIEEFYTTFLIEEK